MKNKRFYRSHSQGTQKHVPAVKHAFRNVLPPKGRNMQDAQPQQVHTTLPSERKAPPLAKEPAAQAGQTSSSKDKGRGSAKSANSSNWKRSKKRVYDPNIGKHQVPVISDSNLLESVVEDANFLAALKKINAEPLKASGVDHKTVRETCTPLIENPNLREQIRSIVLSGKYRPCAIRTAEIPKSNGKTRTLGIATVRDRIIQTMILNALKQQLPSDTWSQYSYAYREGINISHAIQEVDRIRAEGYRYAIQMDLASFFDNVPHDRLTAKLYAHIKDKRVVKLLISFITAVVIGKGNDCYRNRIGVPQGCVLSSYLASMLYLDELDKELSLRGHRFVRYADDITIFCKSRNAAKRVKQSIIGFLDHTMRCPVNRDKTKIVSIGELALLGVFLNKGKWKRSCGRRNGKRVVGICLFCTIMRGLAMIII